MNIRTAAFDDSDGFVLVGDGLYGRVTRNSRVLRHKDLCQKSAMKKVKEMLHADELNGSKGRLVTRTRTVEASPQIGMREGNMRIRGFMNS